MGKVSYWELCKRLNFDHATKWYMYKLGSILDNETHQILREYGIQLDYLITARKPDLEVIYKKKKRKKKRGLARGFCYSIRPQNKNKSKQKDRQILEPYQGTKKPAEQESERGGDTNCSWYTWNDPQRLEKRTRRKGNRKRLRPSRLQHYCDQPEYSEGSWKPGVSLSFRLQWKIISISWYENLQGVK